MQSFNLNLKYKITLSSSMDDLKNKKVKLINKIRSQKKIKEIIYN
jgi:hypothetical protein